jgi:hypothetical protein
MKEPPYTLGARPYCTKSLPYKTPLSIKAHLTQSTLQHGVQNPLRVIGAGRELGAVEHVLQSRDVVREIQDMAVAVDRLTCAGVDSEEECVSSTWELSAACTYVAYACVGR